jgi:protein ImuB
VQRLRLARPDLKRRDFILYERYRGNCMRVAAATASGVSVGMPLAEAQALANVHAELHDPLADQVALVELAARCEQFSPAVGIYPPDNLWLDVTGLSSLFGSEQALLHQVIRMLARRGLSVRAAVADTPGAAWAITHYGRQPYEIVPAGTTRRALAPLPVSALRLTSEAVELLSELGVVRIEQLLRIGRDALVCRFSPQLLERVDQALGTIAEPIDSQRPPTDVAASAPLEYPISNRLSVEAVLDNLTGQIAQQLQSRQQGAVQVECRLDCERATPAKFTVGLYRPSADKLHLLGLIQLQLEQLRLPGPVCGVQLAVLASARLQTVQQELFDSSGREHVRQVNLLVDRLANRLGRHEVVRASSHADAQPELGFIYQPLTGTTARRPSKRPWPRLPRPLRLESEPIPIEPLAVFPEGPPRRFEMHGPHDVARAWGPERIQTGWWRGRYAQRDYYRVETTTGRRFWLYRRLADGQWFLHGWFD